MCPQLLIEHAQEVLPFVYTPVVGEACQKYSHLPITPRGLYISVDDRGRVLEKLSRFRPQASSPNLTPQASARSTVVNLAVTASLRVQIHRKMGLVTQSRCGADDLYLVCRRRRRA